MTDRVQQGSLQIDPVLHQLLEDDIYASAVTSGRAAARVPVTAQPKVSACF